MNTDPPPNVIRRSLGVAICLSPVMLLLASIAFGLMRERPGWSAGMGFMFVAAFFASSNFYLSFIRPPVFRMLRGSMDGFRQISGIPMIGSLLVVLGGVFGFGAVGTALLGLACIGFDTGGSLWFLLSTWRDSSLWDR
jgi:hypothetical protein